MRTMRGRGRRMARRATWLALGLCCAFALPSVAEDWSGRVCVDGDGDGACSSDEPGRAGAVVSNGRSLVRSAADGSWSLPAGQHFAVLTCPSGYACPDWFAPGSADFAIRAAPLAADHFDFVQISDAHVFRDPVDFTRYSLPLPDWLPDSVAGWLGMRFLARVYDPLGPEQIAARLREARPGLIDDDASPGEALLAWVDEFVRPGSELGDVVAAQRAAFAELEAMRPGFVVSTGDLALEGNRSTPEAIERWLAWYVELARSTGLRFHHTIGNNEIAGDGNDAFPRDDPRFGKGAYRRSLGPTRYSFDFGPFHFVALDTHRPEPGWLDARAWSFHDMEPAVRDWLAADLAAHAGRVSVVLNHEPFAGDPDWPFEIETARDQGLLAAGRVRYVLAGHIHRNGIRRVGAIEHITTGALSGSRWMLPAALHPRGYRLFHARGRRLVHAWKALGQPLLERVEVETSASAAGARGPRARAWILAAAGPREPVRGLRASCVGGEALALEAWGRWFARLRLPSSPGACAEVEVRARFADGSERVRRWSAAPPAQVGSPSAGAAR